MAIGELGLFVLIHLKKEREVKGGKKFLIEFILSPYKLTLEKREEDSLGHSFSFDTKSRTTQNGSPYSMSTEPNRKQQAAKGVAFFAAKKIRTK